MTDPIRVTTLAGDPVARGSAHGLLHGAQIRSYTTERLALSEAGTGWDVERIVGLAERMLPAHRSYDEGLYDEMLAMAETAGIAPAEAVIVGGHTDFLDTIRAVAGRAAVEDACIAVIVPDHRADGAGFLAQTWDMNASATPYIVLFAVEPEYGPSSLVFTTVGTLGQIGLNEAGIAVGINNLTADDGKVGVTWPFVVRKILAQTDLDAAVACVLEADLAGGHNYVLFDASGRGVSIEAMPSVCHVSSLDSVPLVHTNHCLVGATIAVEAERPADLDASSTARLEHAGEWIGDGRIVDVDLLIAMMRDERAICRHPEPPWDYESCGAAIMRPATRELWACWGPPCSNDFERFVVGG